MADDDLSFSPPKPNPNLCRILQSKVSRRNTVSVPLRDLVSLESVLFSMGETQSMGMWLIATLLVLLRNSLGPDSDLALYERLCQSFSSSAVRVHALGARASAFLIHLRRSAYISHMPPTVMPDQRSSLLSSDPFSGLLFSPDVMSSLIGEHKSEVASAQAKLASSLEKVIPALLSQSKKGAGNLASGFKGSPLVDRPSSASGASASYSGRRQDKRPRVRSDRGREGQGGRGNPKVPKLLSKNFHA